MSSSTLPEFLERPPLLPDAVPRCSNSLTQPCGFPANRRLGEEKPSSNHPAMISPTLQGCANERLTTRQNASLPLALKEERVAWVSRQLSQRIKMASLDDEIETLTARGKRFLRFLTICLFTNLIISSSGHPPRTVEDPGVHTPINNTNTPTLHETVYKQTTPLPGRHPAGSQPAMPLPSLRLRHDFQGP